MTLLPRVSAPTANLPTMDNTTPDLPDDQTTACGLPLGMVWPELYDENNQPTSKGHMA